MKKGNVLPANVGDVNGPITRARAAALCASANMPAKGPKQQDRKMTLRPSSKRAALDENKSSALDKGGVQSKRRAVLQDVTNVCCENSYQGCFNATKIQGKHRKQIKRGQLNVSKATPSVAVEPQHLQANLKIKNVVKTMNEEPQSEDTSSKSMVKDVPSQLVTMKGFGMGDYLNWDQISRVPSQLRCPPKEATLIGRNVIDIDSDHKDPQLCSIYAADIYNKLLVAELVQRPCSTFMETVQRDITQSMRGILVDWLVEVSEEYKLAPDTLYLTVYLIDWYLSQNYIERNRLQLLGITCMLIASKYEEICTPRVEEFCFITDNTYTREEVVKMESHVLKCFGFNISAPTTKTFLRRFLRAAQASYKSPSYELEYLADYLAELTLPDYSFLNYLPSVIAASAVFLARWTLDQTSHPWNPTLVHYTSYKASDIKSTVFALQDLQLNANGCPLNAIHIKYKQQKFKSVAALSSPKLLETMF